MLNTVQGRQGLGSIWIWASGNGGRNDDSCAADGYASSIYTIAVGSADPIGTQAYYDEACSGKMAVTFSYSSNRYNQIVSCLCLFVCFVGGLGGIFRSAIFGFTVTNPHTASMNITIRHSLQGYTSLPWICIATPSRFLICAYMVLVIVDFSQLVIIISTHCYVAPCNCIRNRSLLLLKTDVSVHLRALVPLHLSLLVWWH